MHVYREASTPCSVGHHQCLQHCIQSRTPLLQLLAGDDQLLQWAKLAQPVIPHSPPGMQLAGFRDPYVIRKGGKGQDWHLLIGSGLKGQSGTLLLYKSKELQSGNPPVCQGLLRPKGQLT